MKKTEEPFSAARLLTTETKRPIAGYVWTRDGKYILYVKDKDGDENFNLYAVDPAAAPAAGADAPRSRDLTGLTGVRCCHYSVPKNDPDTAVHRPQRSRQSLARSLQAEDLHRRADAGAQEYGAHRRLGFRPEGSAAAGGRARPTTAITEILRADAAGFTKIYSCNVIRGVRSACASTRTASASTCETNKGDAMDLSALMLLDPETGKTELVESDPLKRVDFGSGGIFGSHRRTGADHLQGRAHAALFPGQDARERLQVARRQVAGKGNRRSGRAPRTNGSGW